MAGKRTGLEQRFNVRGKVAAIVGGAGYLGMAIAEGMRDAGMTVVILDLTAPTELGAPRRGVTRKCRAMPIVRPKRAGRHRASSYLRCDVLSKRSLKRSCDAIVARHGRVDVLLNAAGTNAPTPFFDISAKEFQRIIDVNLLGTLYGCQVFGEKMVAQRRGSIINFTSVSMGPPLSKAFVYSTAKAGVANLTQNLAREWAPLGVRVNALRPGFFPTEWSLRNFIDEERKRKILNHTPMSRFGEPEELVGAVLWLASEAASFVTGAIIPVDGGFTAMTI